MDISRRWRMQRLKVSVRLASRPISTSISALIVAIAKCIRVPETLSEEVLKKMYAPPKPSDPVASPTTFTEYDYFLFGNGATHALSLFLDSGLT